MEQQKGEKSVARGKARLATGERQPCPIDANFKQTCFTSKAITQFSLSLVSHKFASQTRIENENLYKVVYRAWIECIPVVLHCRSQNTHRTDYCQTSRPLLGRLANQTKIAAVLMSRLLSGLGGNKVVTLLKKKKILSHNTYHVPSRPSTAIHQPRVFHPDGSHRVVASVLIHAHSTQHLGPSQDACCSDGGFS